MSNIRPLLLITALGYLLLPATAPAAETDQDGFNHSVIQQVEKTWVVETEDGAEPIEDLTAYCADCHGDMETTEKQIGHPPGSGVHSHPVDQPYPSAGIGLVPLAELDLRLLLIDGKMTCITCHKHDVHNRQLVIPDAFGELCVSCHRK